MRKLILNITIVLIFTAGALYLSLPLITNHLTTSAATLTSQYRFQQAESLYRRAIQLEPFNFRHYLDLANFYVRTNYYQLRPDTYDLFIKAITLNPASAEAQIGLSRLYMKMGDYLNAEIRIKRAVSLDRNNAGLHLNLCYFYRLIGDIEENVRRLKERFYG